MDGTSFLATLLQSPGESGLGAVEWQQFLAELRTQRLTGFVYSRLRNTSVWPTIPLTVREELSNDFRALSIRAFTMETALESMLKALSTASVPVVLLKGAALGRLVYQNLVERPISDFDLLIPASRVDDAKQALQSQGLNCQSLLWFARRQRRYRAELAMFGETTIGQRLAVELHWSLVEVPYYIDRIPMDEIWETAIALPGKPGVSVPDPSTLLLHCCIHLAMHHSSSLELFWLLDVDRLARWNQLDWDTVLDRARRWQLTLALKRIVDETQLRLGTPLPKDIQQRLACATPDPVEAKLWGLGDGTAGRTRRRIRTTWGVFGRRQRLAYAGWLALRSLFWVPEQVARR